MKKSFFVFAVIIAFAASSCKKEAMPSLISQMDNKTGTVTSITADGIPFEQYVIANAITNGAQPTKFEINLNGGQKSRMYKTDDAYQIETADLIETKSNLLHMEFKDLNAAGIGYQSNTQVTPELITKGIITYQPYNGGGYYQPYYQCSSEVLNGDYSVTKMGNEYTLTRTSRQPVIVMKMTI